ncbi:MAG: hypothetical protein LIO77_09435, partial [Rikenellaceae bacterium]|nr:hypothetical protein [Rikenellaceae bacterium]
MTLANPMKEETRAKIVQDSEKQLKDLPQIVDMIKASKDNIVDTVDSSEEKSIVNDFIEYLIFYHIFFMDLTSIYYMMIKNSGIVNYA